jgi:hypothetical protein
MLRKSDNKVMGMSGLSLLLPMSRHCRVSVRRSVRISYGLRPTLYIQLSRLDYILDSLPFDLPAFFRRKEEVPKLCS